MIFGNLTMIQNRLLLRFVRITNNYNADSWWFRSTSSERLSTASTIGFISLGTISSIAFLFGLDSSIRSARRKIDDSTSNVDCSSATATAAVESYLWCRWNPMLQLPFTQHHDKTCGCEDGGHSHHEYDGLYLYEDDEKHKTEPQRFLENLQHHRYLLLDYKDRWIIQREEEEEEEEKDSDPDNAPQFQHSDWPRRVPCSNEVSGLEFDLMFCERHKNAATKATKTGSENELTVTKTKRTAGKRIPSIQQQCQNLKFRIASYYLLREQNTQRQKKGLKLIKELAESGHPDGMCLYGIVLNEGKVAGIDANPDLAVTWWRRCIDSYQHVPSIYEFAVALYTGEGVVENTRLAVKYFVHAANKGHAGAAYMLGECLLNGIDGNPHRDRGSALEWLVDAAELGHRNAQQRVLSVLETDYENYKNTAIDEASRLYREEEQLKWHHDEDYDDDDSGDDISNDSQIFPTTSHTITTRKKRGSKKQPLRPLERRFTIGGGSRNPAILKRRLSAVRESRKD